MKTERLLQSGVLNTGEPRHYDSWTLPQVPRLNTVLDGTMGEALYRRQKAFAPKVAHERGWMRIWYALRKG